MFDRIAPSYDRLNRLLSFGTDRSWRARAVALARPGPGERALDIGAGTGDLSLGLLEASDPSATVVGVDLSQRMLALSRARLARMGLQGRYAAAIGNAERLPLPDGSVDRIISGFTLRNIGDLPRALREMRRVLRPNGRAVLLELSHPPSPIFRVVYRWYFEQVAPPFAMLFGGDRDAYRYLPRSLRPFPTADALAAMLRAAGFADVRYELLTLGIAAIHVGERPTEDSTLASAPEIIVVLGGRRTARERAQAGAELARQRPEAIVILTGHSAFDVTEGPPEAEIMARVLRESGIAGDRLRLEDESRDTIGNAVLTAARYLRHVAPRPISLVTSPFHMERSLYVFRTVLGPKWPVTPYPSAAVRGDEDRAPLERGYLEETRRTLAGVEPGDLAAVAARLRNRWPEFYAGIARLDPHRLA
jgi:demethylmenaquinone methyltransferase/2-methoxy-6-polyprenyl-1,4-benzoquinol methylase